MKHRRWKHTLPEWIVEVWGDESPVGSLLPVIDPPGLGRVTLCRRPGQIHSPLDSLVLLPVAIDGYYFTIKINEPEEHSFNDN